MDRKGTEWESDSDWREVKNQDYIYTKKGIKELKCCF